MKNFLLLGVATLATSALALGPTSSVFNTPMCKELKCVFKSKTDMGAYRNHPAYSEYDYRIKDYASQGPCGTNLNSLFVRRKASTMETIDVVFSSPFQDCRLSEGDFKKAVNSILSTYVSDKEIAKMKIAPHKSIADACFYNNVGRDDMSFQKEFKGSRVKIKCGFPDPEHAYTGFHFSIHFIDEYGV